MNFKEFTQLSPEQAEKYVADVEDERVLLELAASGIEELRKLAEEHKGTSLGAIMNDFLEMTEKEFKALKDLSDTLEELDEGTN